MSQEIVVVLEGNPVVVQHGDVQVVEVSKGIPGDPGTDGENGVGVPAGGTAGQVLEKVDGTDFNTQWVTPVVPQVGVEKTINFVGTVVALAFSLIASAIQSRTIQKLNGLKTSAGTCTVSVAINGTPVTGLNGLSASTTAQDFTATANNTVDVGDEVTISITSPVSAADLKFTIGME